MTNVAEIYKFPETTRNVINNHEAPGGYVKADIEQGFDRLAHKITDTLANPPVSLSGREYQIINAVVAKTYRWHKRTDYINNVQLSELTGIAASHISELKKSLVEKGVLFTEGRNVGINPIVSEWGKSYPKRGKDKVTRKGVSNYPNTGSELPENGYKITRKRGTQKKETNTKETIQKKAPKAPTKKHDFSSWPCEPSEEVLTEWLAMRKSKRASVSQLVINRFAKELHLAAQNGISVDECLTECVTRNWQGFNYAWIARQHQTNGYSSMPSRSNNVGDQLAAMQEAYAHIPMPGDDEVIG
ncbi:replication protein O [Pseudoalteromonas phage vB_Pun_Y3]